MTDLQAATSASLLESILLSRSKLNFKTSKIIIILLKIYNIKFALQQIDPTLAAIMLSHVSKNPSLQFDSILEQNENYICLCIKE